MHSLYEQFFRFVCNAYDSAISIFDALCARFSYHRDGYTFSNGVHTCTCFFDRVYILDVRNETIFRGPRYIRPTYNCDVLINPSTGFLFTEHIIISIAQSRTELPHYQCHRAKIRHTCFITVTSHERHGVQNPRQLDCLFNMILRLKKHQGCTGPLWMEPIGDPWLFPLT